MEAVRQVLGGSSEEQGESQASSAGQENTTVAISTTKAESILDRDRNDIDWRYIQKELEEINNSWVIITIDLNSLGVNNENILAFDSYVDAAINYVKAKDKPNSLISIANMYNLLPKFIEVYSNDSKEIELAYIKSDIVASYAILETAQWDKVSDFLGDAETRCIKILDSANSDNSFKKMYVLLKDYIKSTNNKDLDLSYMKYYYLIKDVENL